MHTLSQRRLFVYWLIVVALLVSQAMARSAQAEDGYDLWLRYRPVEAARLHRYRNVATELVGGTESSSLLAARSELTRALGGLLGAAPRSTPRPTRDGAIVFGTPASSTIIAALHLD